FIDFACREKNIEKNAVLKNLATFGIGEARLREKLADYTVEEKKQVVCAIVFAEVKDVVFNDFIKGASRKFEEQFLTLVSRSAVGGRKIIYISNEMYNPVSSFANREVKINGYQTFQVTPRAISCR
ncbi:MAG: hypothetical protein GY950_15400, partial [bacterium]|nr:hypothetical protein [bacterium]